MYQAERPGHIRRPLVEVLAHAGQVRVWWEDTPVDVFLDIHQFHAEVAEDVRSVPCESRLIARTDPPRSQAAPLRVPRAVAGIG